mmetsp:Transcript_34197/g.102086  ORF Transcript_34197/g.102086 Transcript_34197/m.102086 type:complete len:242 (+) Transcript_34197:921-1646(+)
MGPAEARGPGMWPRSSPPPCRCSAAAQFQHGGAPASGTGASSRRSSQAGLARHGDLCGRSQVAPVDGERGQHLGGRARLHQVSRRTAKEAPGGNPVVPLHTLRDQAAFWRCPPLPLLHSRRLRWPRGRCRVCLRHQSPADEHPAHAVRVPEQARPGLHAELRAYREAAPLPPALGAGGARPLDRGPRPGYGALPDGRPRRLLFGCHRPELGAVVAGLPDWRCAGRHATSLPGLRVLLRHRH